MDLHSGAAMRPQSLRRGWCPTAAVPMEAADGLLLRVRPPAGRLTSRDLRSLADIAEAHGNGAVVLTRRAKLELRGIRDGEAAATALQQAGLAPSDPGAQALPDLIVSPATDLDDSADADVSGVYSALVAALVDWPGSAGLPAKFALVLDGGGRAHVGTSDGDLRFDAVRLADRVAYRVALAGNRAEAKPLGLCTAEAVPSVALGLLARFDELRAGREEVIWRMRHAVAELGVQRFREAVAGQLDAASGEPAAGGGASALGPAGAWHGLAWPFGRLDAGGLRRLADVVEASGAGDVRVLPTRALLLPGVPGDALDTLRETGAGDRDADPRLRVEACSGLGGCAHASTYTRDDALALADRLPGLLDGERRCVLHVSGCAKGCAHSGAAAITLTGNDGRYDLGLLSQPGEDALWSGLDADAAAERLAALERALAAERAPNEQLETVLARLDRADLRERIERELTSG